MEVGDAEQDISSDHSTGSASLNEQEIGKVNPTLASLTTTHPTVPPTTPIINQSLQSLSNSIDPPPLPAGPLQFLPPTGPAALLEAAARACSISGGVRPFDSRKAIRWASGEEEVDGSRRKVTALLIRAERG